MLQSELIVPEVRFDIDGAAWGYYMRRGKKRWIRYNPLLFSRYYEEGLNETVPHEVAHYVVDCIDDSVAGKRSMPHGAEWKSVMKFLGVSNPRATATYDTSGLNIRRQNRYVYRCGCRNHELTTTRHKRVLRGQHYLCRVCGDELKVAENRGSS